MSRTLAAPLAPAPAITGAMPSAGAGPTAPLRLTRRGRLTVVLLALPVLPVTRLPRRRLPQHDDGTAIRRRRECPECGKRFTTVETGRACTW
jgi:hypothetical protein